MVTSPIRPEDRIIVPLDVSNDADAQILIDRLPQVTFWKVGLELFVSTGPAILERLQQQGKRIFLDLKFHDIPNTMAGACRAASAYGVDLLTVHTTAGPAALQATMTAAQAGAAAAGTPAPQLIAVTLLTSISEELLTNDLKVSLGVANYALHMALLAKHQGLAGSVCSPQEAALLRQHCGKDWLLVCPGVRPHWAQAGDQSRVMTPSEAISAGADYLVIGRPITQAARPEAAFQQICHELASPSA